MRTTLMVLLALAVLNASAATAAEKKGIRASRPAKAVVASKAVHPKCTVCPKTGRCL